MWSETALHQWRLDMINKKASEAREMKRWWTRRRFITISTVASELGHYFDSQTLIEIGKLIKQEYIKKYNTEPPKHEQIVAGVVRPVCFYQAKDRDMIEAVVNTFVC